jgi:hypothetical protein
MDKNNGCTPAGINAVWIRRVRESKSRETGFPSKVVRRKDSEEVNIPMRLE